MAPAVQCKDKQEIKTEKPKNIRDILSCRSDLSTFLVHLTRDEDGKSAKDKLRLIVNDWIIKAKSPFGSAVRKLKDKNKNTDSQRCVCFTETPIEHLRLLVGKIKGRKYMFGSYGVAIPKKLARRLSVNPIWYVDMTKDCNFLMDNINTLIQEAIKSDDFNSKPIAKIGPFVEQMGDWRKTSGKRKEFWWEREWRHLGDLKLPEKVILICPENEREEFQNICKEKKKDITCVDPYWSLEQIIAYLVGFNKYDVDYFSNEETTPF